MENSKESQNKFLDSLIINFLEKFKKYTSNLENNEDNNEFYTMIFILSYITSNNLIDTATLDKYLNGNQIYEVFKKKRNVLNELSEKYKDKIQEGGGFFNKLLKFIVVLSMFNSAVESHVVVEPEALTTSARSLRLWKNNPELIRPRKLDNQDGRCALIQALITNPPEEADQLITEYTDYYTENKNFGWSPQLIDPETTEFKDENIIIRRGFTKDFGNKAYVIIYGYLFSTIMKYVKDTIKEIMDGVFSQPGYIEGQISMSLIGIPGHAETLLLRKHNGNTYYGILGTNTINWIDLFSAIGEKTFPSLYTVQPGFFTPEELNSMKSDLYSNIIRETDTPIEDVSPKGKNVSDTFLGVSLEIPTKQNPLQTHIPALVIPSTNGERLKELGDKMAVIIKDAKDKADAEAAIIKAENDAFAKKLADDKAAAEAAAKKQVEDLIAARKKIHDDEIAARKKIEDDEFAKKEAARKKIEDDYDAERQAEIAKSDANTSEINKNYGPIDSLWKEIEAQNKGNEKPDLDKIVQIFKKIENKNNELKVKLNDPVYDTLPKVKEELNNKLISSEDQLKRYKDYLDDYIKENNLKSGGKVFNKTRRKKNKSKSKTKRRNYSKTKRRNNFKTKRRNKTRRRK